jgi:hypothetical protein
MRAKLAITKFDTKNNQYGSIFEIDSYTATTAMAPRQVTYESTSGLMYILIERDGIAVFYSIIVTDYPDFSMMVSVTNTNISNFYSFAIKDNDMFIATGLASGAAGLIRTNKFLNSSEFS